VRSEKMLSAAEALPSGPWMCTKCQTNNEAKEGRCKVATCNVTFASYGVLLDASGGGTRPRTTRRPPSPTPWRAHCPLPTAH
jgi:hypothetical protein